MANELFWTIQSYCHMLRNTVKINRNYWIHWQEDMYRKLKIPSSRARKSKRWKKICELDRWVSISLLLLKFGQHRKRVISVIQVEQNKLMDNRRSETSEEETSADMNECTCSATYETPDTLRLLSPWFLDVSWNAGARRWRALNGAEKTIRITGNPFLESILSQQFSVLSVQLVILFPTFFFF